MKLTIVFIFLIFSGFCRADDLLNVINSKSEATSAGNESTVLTQQSLRGAASAQLKTELTFLDGSFWSAFLEEKNSTALKLFLASEPQVPTPAAQILKSYLLYKTGFETLALDKLLTVDNSKIPESLRNLWRAESEKKPLPWAKTTHSWNATWTSVFGTDAEFQTLFAKNLQTFDVPTIESMLVKSADNSSMAREWMQWRYANALAVSGDVKKAALVLKLLFTKKNSYITEDLLNLTVARLLYGNGYLNEAIAYYGKVKPKSEYWFEAVEEKAWAYLRKGETQNALASVENLTQPVFSTEVTPEVSVLRAIALLKTCDYEDTSKEINLFRSTFKERFIQLTRTSQNMQNLNQLHDRLLVEKKLTKASDTVLPRFLLTDFPLSIALANEHTYKEELAVFGTAFGSGELSPLESKLKEELETKATSGNKISLARLQELYQSETSDIEAALRKMQVVEAELAQQTVKAEAVIAQLSGVQIQDKKGTTGSEGKDRLQFRKDSELWFDELGNYRADISHICGAGRNTVKR